MEKTKTTSNSNTNLKAIIIVLALLLAGSLAYIFTLKTDVTTTQTSLTTEKTEKDKLMQELQTLKATYDAALAENTTMSADLVTERDKVVALMSDLQKSRGNASSLKKYKEQFLALDLRMKELSLENESLKRQNGKLTVQRDSTGVVLSQARNQNQELSGQNEELARTVEKGAKLNVMNVKAVAYKVKKSGKQTLTEKAGSADILKISFTIAANPIAKAGEKEYYVQIIDATNAILGDKKQTTFEDGKTLEYSFITTVKYDNQAVDVSQDIAGSKFAKGTYFVNIFDKGEMVSTSNVTLK
ncbi:MAG: hypothetical protein V4548_05645 [Bacteroidota bacterium]